jgi:hypothetical protein
MAIEIKYYDTEIIDINELKPAGYNPRFMSRKEKDNLRKSIELGGLVEDIVINKDRTIIGGHQRYSVLKEMGAEKVPVKIVDLTKRQEKILNLALNEVSGEWKEEDLATLIDEIRNDAIGFTEEEINQYIMRKSIMSDLGRDNYDPDDDDEIKQRFENSERVPIRIKEPEEKFKKTEIAFYAENFEQYQMIRDEFKTTRKGELDLNKLITFLRNDNKEQHPDTEVSA